eukprot:scaffold2353_cov181-Ochromonas_danica.AAC.8
MRLLLFSLFFLFSLAKEIEVYTLENFPNHEKVALHMPCEESNVFPTKCMCHIRCADPACLNAKNLCRKKYEHCKYLILRGGQHNRFATLKRSASAEEEEAFDLTAYRTQPGQGQGQEKGAGQGQRRWDGPVLSQWLPQLGAEGEEVLAKLFSSSSSSSSSPSRKHCGQAWQQHGVHQNESARREAFLRQGVSLVALTYHSPRTLLNSMHSWQTSGLLSWAKERILILNDPLPEEVAIGRAFNFTCVQPRDLPHSKTTKNNVWTIGAAFYYALQLISQEYDLPLTSDPLPLVS